MSDKSRGFYNKFFVERTDGTSAAGQKHDGCEYFVLDLTHDKFAIAAIVAYAKACELEYPKLSADLRLQVHAMISREHGSGHPPEKTSEPNAQSSTVSRQEAGE